MSNNYRAGQFQDVIKTLKHAVLDIKKYIILALSYIEAPITAVAGIIDSIVHIIIHIFSNYNELENDCNLSNEILEEISNNKILDQRILKEQIHSILSIPLTVIIMYNWLYLTCFKERIIINTTVEDWIKSLVSGISTGGSIVTGAISSGISVASGAMNAASSVVKDIKGENNKLKDEGKTEEGKTEEGKTEEGKTDEAKTEEGKTEEGKTEEGKTEEAKTEEGKTEEAKTEEPKKGGWYRNKIRGGDGEAAAPAAGPAAPTGPTSAPPPPAAAPAAPAAEGDAAAPAAEEKPASKLDKLKKGYDKMMEGDPLSDWKVYAPILHMIAPVSIIDKWIFGFWYIINTYVISPNLHPLLYYMLFFKVFFDFVRKNQNTIGKTLSDAIDYLFSDNKSATISIPGNISQWSALFVTWSFMSSIPEGVMKISKEFWIVSVVKAFLFVISYVVIMIYIDQVCIYVILYLLFYSFGAINWFSGIGLYKTMHAIDIYFYKRITSLQNKGDRILNLCINTTFLFIFEILVLTYLIKGIASYISEINAIELKITMTLINLMMIYLLMKYCSYKFHTVWPSYKNDVKDENYNKIRKDFGDVIPIESYADAVNSYNYQDAANQLNEMKFQTDWSDWTSIGSNAAKTLYNTAVSNTITKTALTAANKAKEDFTKGKEDISKKVNEMKEKVSEFNENAANANANFKLSNIALPPGLRGNSSEPTENTNVMGKIADEGPLPSPGAAATTTPPPAGATATTSPPPAGATATTSPPPAGATAITPQPPAGATTTPPP